MVLINWVLIPPRFPNCMLYRGICCYTEAGGQSACDQCNLKMFSAPKQKLFRLTICFLPTVPFLTETLYFMEILDTLLDTIL